MVMVTMAVIPMVVAMAVITMISVMVGIVGTVIALLDSKISIWTRGCRNTCYPYGQYGP